MWNTYVCRHASIDFIVISMSEWGNTDLIPVWQAADAALGVRSNELDDLNSTPIGICPLSSL